MTAHSMIFVAMLALTAAACWGSGDFTGGFAARRSSVFRTVLISYGFGLVSLVIVALVRAEPLPSSADLAWGAVSGLMGMIGLGFLFQGFATGRMGIVSPVSAVLATALPVIFNALTEGLPGVLTLAGFATAIVGIWLLSRPDKMGKRPEGLGLAIMAGLGFGAFFIALDQVGPKAVFWPLVAGRFAACLAMLVFAFVTRRPVWVEGTPLLILALAGVLDVAGNLFFLLAIQNGRLDVASVLGSLYPAVTALLARWIAKEHLTQLQIVGICAAVLAIILITV